MPTGKSADAAHSLPTLYKLEALPCDIQIVRSIKNFVNELFIRTPKYGVGEMLITHNPEREDRGNRMILVRVEVEGPSQEAVDMLAHDADFDLILMACQVPLMDAYTATRALRVRQALADLPLVALTANAMAGELAGSTAAPETAAGLRRACAAQDRFNIDGAVQQLEQSPGLKEQGRAYF